MNTFPRTDYDNLILEAKANIHTLRKDLKEFTAWSYLFLALGICFIALSVPAGAILVIFVVPSGYGFVTARRAAKSASEKLKYWEDEYFLWSSAATL